MRILVVSPHPDDETLGMGGTLLKLRDKGHELAWLNVTMATEEYGYSADFVISRCKQVEMVKKEYGFKAFYNLGLEPAGVDEISKKELVARFRNIFNEFKPEIIFVPYAYDVHSDHRVISEAIYSCTKAFRYPFIKAILEMEILSETDYANPESGFVPNCFVNIENYVEEKIRIMKIYQSEIKDPPFPRSEGNIRSLATVRGCSSGYLYAEAFKIIKIRVEEF